MTYLLAIYSKRTATQAAEDREGVGLLARTVGRVAVAMRDAGVDQSEIDDYLKRAMAGDYENLLRVTMEMVPTEAP